MHIAQPDWRQLIDDSAMSNREIVARLSNDWRIKYSEAAINKLRTGATREPSYKVGYALISIFNQGVIENEKRPT
ncbi:MAG: hypothetical protein HKO06_06670, partial [Pseudomonadales bacterium]|nr:hypothetical protein [Pseudomonadales bacterium]